MRIPAGFLRVALLLCLVLFLAFPGAEAGAFGTSENYPVGWYHYIGAADKLKERVSDPGANLVVAWPATFNVTQARNFLDTAQANGVQVLMSVVGNPGETAARNFINTLASHPALAGWYLSDEPEEFGDPPSYMYPAIHSASPVRPAFVVHYAPMFADQYKSITDVLMLDHYPGYGISASQQTLFHHRIGNSYDDWAFGVNWAKTNAKEGFVAVAQGFDDDKNMTEDEFRYHALSAVAAGADGLLFWHCDPEDESIWNTGAELRAMVNRVFAYLNRTEIGKAMRATQNFDSAHYRGVNDPRVSPSASSTQIAYRYGISQTHQVILAVNISGHQGDNTGVQLSGVSFGFPGVSSGTVNVVGENRTLPLVNGRFTDTFAPYAVHAYSVGPGAGPTSTPTVLSGDANGDGRVDGQDYIIWLTNYGSTAGGSANGDFDGDGRVGGTDYIIWVDTFGGGATEPPVAEFNFISWSDTQGGISTLSALSGQAKALGAEFTIFNGDLCASGFTVSCTDEWKAALNGNSNNGTSDKTFSVRGNHDALNSSGWQSYFNMAEVAQTVGARNYHYLADDLTYAFDFGNSHFIGVDVPGCGNKITQAQIDWVDNDLTQAESRGLRHAFLFFHGPIYYVDGHTECGLPQGLVDVIDEHPSLTATFHGHEHIKTATHFGPDNGRIIGMTHDWEQIVSGGAGGELYDCNQPSRTDYCGSYQGFANVRVKADAVTVDFYRQGSNTPVKTYGFSK